MTDLESVTVHSGRLERVGRARAGRLVTYALPLLMTIASLGGCAIGSEAGRQYIRENPNLPAHIKHNIRTHRVERGMTKPQVVASIGDPYLIRSWQPHPYDDTRAHVGGIIPGNLGELAYNQAWEYMVPVTRTTVRQADPAPGRIFGIEIGPEYTGSDRVYFILFRGDVVHGTIDAGVR